MEPIDYESQIASLRAELATAKAEAREWHDQFCDTLDLALERAETAEAERDALKATLASIYSEY